MLFLPTIIVLLISLLSLQPRQGLVQTAQGLHKFADVVKLVDTPDLGSGAERCAGSSPSIRTKVSLAQRGLFF